ncbi:hypothetical protein H5U35_04235, partial [Candidatus Aerophobetes bacterium]|nr:hypothetical protein [Candidatus Aerophobetes bacterium]
MKKVKLFYFLLLFLLFPFVFAYAQEEELKKLPTIVIRGEDRSYLEIIREKRINYMDLRGEKIKFEPPLALPFTPPVREILQPPVSFPPLAPSKVKLSFYPEEPGKIPPRSLTLPPPPKTYLGEERLSFPLLKEKKVPLLKKTVQKRLIYPPIEEISIPKRTYTPSPVAYSVPEQKLRKKIPQKVDISPHMPSVSPVLPTYIKEEKISLSVERKKEVVLPKKIPGEKVETEKISLLTEVSPEEKERKRLIKPPLTAPFISKSLFPKKMERSNYPYLLFSLSSDDNGGFGY